MLSVTTSDHQSPTYVMTLCEKEVEVERVCDYVLKSGKKGCRDKLLVICDGPMEESSCQCATLWSHQFSVPTKLPHWSIWQSKLNEVKQENNEIPVNVNESTIYVRWVSRGNKWACLTTNQVQHLGVHTISEQQLMVAEMVIVNWVLDLSSPLQDSATCKLQPPAQADCPTMDHFATTVCKTMNDSYSNTIHKKLELG